MSSNFEAILPAINATPVAAFLEVRNDNLNEVEYKLIDGDEFVVTDGGKKVLYLTRPEFADMCHGSIVERIADIVWGLCGRHIGVAFNIICFFQLDWQDGLGDIRPI